MDHSSSHPRLVAVAAGALVAVSACSNDAGTSTALPRGADPVHLDPADFRPSSDHPYFPLVPGTRWTYRSTDTDGSESTVVVTVTGRTRHIADGITARTVRDTATQDGEITEDTYDWYAQDRDGNVWYLGESTAELESGGVVSTEGSWEAGVDGALPGVIMPAHPAAGQAYRQEHYAGKAEDDGAILATHQQVETEQGHHDDALLSADTSALEPDVVEYKLYARGVGLALTVAVSGESEREALVSVRTVPPAVARAAGTTPLGTPYE